MRSAQAWRDLAESTVRKVEDSDPNVITQPFMRKTVELAHLYAAMAQVPEELVAVAEAERVGASLSVFLNYAVKGENPCDACGQPINEGDEMFTLVTEGRPWLTEDHADQTWPIVSWHRSCDKGSLAADGAEDHRAFLAHSSTVRGVVDGWPDRTPPVQRVQTLTPSTDLL